MPEDVAARTSRTVFDAVGGSAGVRRLAEAWHARVTADEVVAHAFERGVHPQHTERLAAYWGEAWGGPPTYTERYGTQSDVVRIHSGNGPHDEMDLRSIVCFDRAMDDVGLDDPRLRRVLHDYFTWATTTAMAAYPVDAEAVPDGLSLPRWSWDGLLEGP
jgi:hemoglobin